MEDYSLYSLMHHTETALLYAGPTDNDPRQYLAPSVNGDLTVNHTDPHVLATTFDRTSTKESVIDSLQVCAIDRVNVDPTNLRSALVEMMADATDSVFADLSDDYDHVPCTYVVFVW